MTGNVLIDTFQYFAAILVVLGSIYVWIWLSRQAGKLAANLYKPLEWIVFLLMILLAISFILAIVSR